MEDTNMNECVIVSPITKTKRNKGRNKQNLFEYDTMEMFQESTGIEEKKLMETKRHNQASEEQGR